MHAMIYCPVSVCVCVCVCCACVQEPRLSIHLLLLKVFGVLCGLGRTVVGILLASVLPNELGRDIQQNTVSGDL